MSIQEVFSFNEGKKMNFEDFSHENGCRYWYARELMLMLGYENYESFKKAINRAIAACAALNIPVDETISQITREIDGKMLKDHKVNRFGCYLIAMNGDSKKPQVAAAQAYFAAVAESIRLYIQEAENVERVLIRDEITDHEKALATVAKNGGVNQYQLFQNAGYRGLYNMNYNKLKDYKGIPAKRSLMDFMGKEELAANLFRLTQTEAKIKNENITGQQRLENAAEQVGQKIRKTMIDISGTRPEDLEITEDIKDVKKELKQTARKFLKMDTSKDK